MHPDYVPSLFDYLTPEQRKRKINSYSKFEQIQAVKRKRRTHDVGPVAPCDDTSAQEGRGQTADPNYCNSTVDAESSVPCSNEACQETVRKLTEVCTALRSEVYQLREKVSKLSFSQETFKDNDDMVQDLTGLPSFAKLMVVFTFVSEFLKVGPGLSPFKAFE